MQWSNDTACEKENAELKRKIKALEGAVVNEKNERVKVESEIAEVRRKHNEDIYKLSQQRSCAVATQEALLKKTEEWKQSELQKANALSTNLSLEKQLKTEQAEIKRLENQLNSAANSSSGIPQPQNKLKQDNAALQKRVQVLEEENAKLVQAKTTSSRTSITPADPARSRLGFGGAPSALPTRPGSSMGHNSQPITTGRRRSSSGSAIPSATTTSSSATNPPSPRFAQLELNLASSHKRTDALNKELNDTKVKLCAKERLLLQVENKVIALEKEREDGQKEARADKDELRRELAFAQRETASARKEAEAQQAGVVKELRDEKVSLSRRVQQLTAEADQTRSAVERLEVEKDGLERKLAARDDDFAAAKNDIATLAADYRELEEAYKNQVDSAADPAELARLEGENDQLGLALAAKTAEKETLEQQLVASQKERNKLSAAANKVEAEWAEAKDSWDQQKAEMAKMASWSVERKVLEFELEAKISAIAGLEGNLSALRDEHASQSAELVKTHGAALAESSARVEALEAAHGEAQEALSVAKADLSALAEERDAAVTKLAELEQAHSDVQVAAADAEARLATATEAHVQAVGKYAELEQTHDELKATLHETEASLVATKEAHTDARAQLASSQKALSAVAVTANLLVQRRDEALAALNELNEECSEVEGKLEVANAELEEMKRKRDEHEDDRLYVVAQINKMTASRDGRLSSQASDETVHALVQELGVKEGSIRDLEQRIADLTSAEADTQASRSVAERKVAELEGEVARLNGEVERLAQEASGMEEATLLAKAEAAKSAQQAEEVEVELQAEVALREEAEAHVVELEEQVSTLEGVETQLVDARERGAALQAELEGAKNELAAAGENAAASSVAATDASFEITKLQRQLELTQVELHEAEQELAHLKATLAAVPTAVAVPLPPSPIRTSLSTTATLVQPASPTLSAASASSALSLEDLHKPAILVQRLRDDRDLARVQLDFARTEARFQLAELRDALRASEEAKAAVHVRLVEAGTALKEEVQSTREARELLRVKEEEVGRLKGQLEEAKAAFSQAQVGHAEDAEQLQAMIESAEQERDDLLVQVEQLEVELDQARVDRDQALVKAADASASAGEGAEIARLREEADLLQGRVLRRTERIGELEQTVARLEQQVALARVFDSDEDDTVEIVAEAGARPDARPAQAHSAVQTEVSEGLERELEEVKGELADAQEEVIELRSELNKSLAALEEAKATVERTANQADEALADRDAAEEALSSLQAQHGEVVAQLKTIVAEREAAAVAKGEVEAELAAGQAALATATEQLATSQAEAAELSAKLVELRNNQSASLAAESAHAAALEAHLDEANARRDRLAGNLLTAQSSLDKAEDKLALCEADKAALEDEVNALEQDKTALLAEMAEHDASAQLEMSRAANLENQLAEQRDLHAELQAAHANLAASHNAELDAVANDFETLVADLKAKEDEALGLTKLRDELQGAVEKASEEKGELQRELGKVAADLEQANKALALLNSDANTQHNTQAELEREFTKAREAVASLEREHARLREELDQAAADKDHLERELAAARDSATGSADARAQLDALQAQLEQKQRTVEQLHDALEQQRVQAQETQAAAAEAAEREIQHVRQAELESKRAVQTLEQERAQLEHVVKDAGEKLAEAKADKVVLELELHVRKEKDKQHTIEALKLADIHLQEIKELKETVVRMSTELATRPGPARRSAEDAALIDELETAVRILEQRVEAAEQEYLDELKEQKHLTARIESYRVQLVKLKVHLRELEAARAPAAPASLARSPPASVPSSRVVSLASSTASATGSPRAGKRLSDDDTVRRGPWPLYAEQLVSVPGLSLAATSPRALPVDKENARSPLRVVAPLPLKLSVRPDGVVPLKPAGVEQGVRRVALGEVKPAMRQGQGGAGPAVGAAPLGLVSKTDELRARLASNKLGGVRRVGSA